jgi:hypothetical protein
MPGHRAEAEAALIPAIVSHQPLPWLVLCPLVFALATVPWVLAVAGRKIAFRADMTGIALGASTPLPGARRRRRGRPPGHCLATGPRPP